MKRIPREKAMEYEFNKDRPPVFKVKLEESFIVETEDAASGYIRSAEELRTPERCPQLKFTPPKSNPLGGPVYVEGVEPGDLLIVNIERIIVDYQGVTYLRPGVGPLGDSLKWAELSQYYTHIFKHVPGPSGTLHDGKVIFNEKISWDLQPFIGTIGVAPEREVETSIVGQGPWGGNLDCKDMKEGSKFYVNCFHEGGLLYLGDVHGSQADTEFTSTADETRAEVMVSCEVIKAKRIPFLRLEKPESIISLYCSRPLEDAVQNAMVNLMEWLVREYRMSPREAYLHMSVNPDVKVHVYQMVKLGRLGFTVGVEFPKKYLG